jgi:tRNA(Arg) A34 adenosine deaminase TadA
MTEDARHLRRAIELAWEGRRRGDGAFGAVLVSGGGSVLAEASNRVVTESDVTAHAETRLVQEASRRHGPDALVGSTLYASCEPCPMCSGAIFWAGVERVVYGLSAARLGELVADAGPRFALGCRELLERGTRPVEVVGPMLEDEAAEPFIAR